MKKTIAIIGTLVLTLVAGAAIAGKPDCNPKKEDCSATTTTTTTSDAVFSCDIKDSFTYVAVAPASDTQAKLVMSNHCGGMDPSQIQALLSTLTQADIEGVICHYDASQSFCM